MENRLGLWIALTFRKQARGGQGIGGILKLRLSLISSPKPTLQAHLQHRMGGRRAPCKGSPLIWGCPWEAAASREGPRKEGGLPRHSMQLAASPTTSLPRNVGAPRGRATLITLPERLEQPAHVSCLSRWALNQWALHSSSCSQHRTWTPANTAAQKPLLLLVCLPDTWTVSSKMHPPRAARDGWHLASCTSAKRCCNTGTA